ncbi:hypothetical protein [Kordia sp. SMS9]|uniref:hypothetical protein n=1 Tax=Kordia sp. SMS9 TaxID=2282170 RepID=UPI0013B3DF06|nr:hypothetical protein [Kordia sp. SMS9]
MKVKSIILLMNAIFLILSACSEKKKQEKVNTHKKASYEQIVTPTYELEKPQGTASAVLVLFGGYPEVASDIKREFNILKAAQQHNIAVLYSNYNRKLWFENNELETLAQQLNQIFTTHHLATDNVFFGGFSSGGNVALLLGNHLTASQNKLKPKGIFIVDSPIDLAVLYQSAEKNVNRNFSDVSVQEGRFLLQLLGDRFGNPAEAMETYEKYAVFTSETNHTDNLSSLKNTKLRFYTEPDTLWWQKERMASYEQMNAYYIQQLAQKLTAENFTHVEYIPTENKGYRANGERHPHSWSIVDVAELIKFMLIE